MPRGSGYNSQVGHECN